MEPYFKETDQQTGITLKIVPDTDASCPTEDDHSIIMAALHRRYSNPAEKLGLTTPNDIAAFTSKNPGWIEIPLYLYDHSGTVYRVGLNGNPFLGRAQHAEWDSGRLGSVFVNWRAHSIPQNKSRADKIAACLLVAEQFCTDYTAWANGNVWEYLVEDAEGSVIDSCAGFYGSPQESVLTEGRAAFKGAKGDVK